MVRYTDLYSELAYLVLPIPEYPVRYFLQLELAHPIQVEQCFPLLNLSKYAKNGVTRNLLGGIYCLTLLSISSISLLV